MFLGYSNEKSFYFQKDLPVKAVVNCCSSKGAFKLILVGDLKCVKISTLSKSFIWNIRLKLFLIEIHKITDMPSISSTFYACVFCTKFWRQKLQS